MKRRKKQEVYYALSGSNAYGIFNNYEKAIASRLYVTKSNIKKFYDFEDAKEWAEDRFNEMQVPYLTGYKIKEIKKVNWCYFRKKV